MASSSTPKPKLYITCNLQTKIKTQCTLYKMSSLISHRALLGVVQLKCTMYNIKARQQVYNYIYMMTYRREYNLTLDLTGMMIIHGLLMLRFIIIQRYIWFLETI